MRHVYLFFLLPTTIPTVHAHTGEIGPDDLVTKFQFKGTMNDMTSEDIERLTTAPSEEFQQTGFFNNFKIFFIEFIEHFALGAVAGGIGAAAVYPIDLGKTRLQNQVVV